jgi:hypothetical protein
MSLMAIIIEFILFSSSISIENVLVTKFKVASFTPSNLLTFASILEVQFTQSKPSNINSLRIF